RAWPRSNASCSMDPIRGRRCRRSPRDESIVGEISDPADTSNTWHLTESEIPEIVSRSEQHITRAGARKSVLFITNTSEFGGAERHVLDLVRRLGEPDLQVSILCLGEDFFTERLDPEQNVRVITCARPPRSLWQWAQLFRSFHADVAILVYSWLWSLPWATAVGVWLAGIPRRISIHHLVTSPGVRRLLVRRLAGGMVRRL